MVGDDGMGPALQIGVQTLRNVDITQISNGYISVLLETTVTWSGTLVVLYVLHMLI